MSGRSITPELLRSMPLPEAGGGKEERGRVLVVAGSRDVPGAALLAAESVLRVGAGKLQILAPASIALPLGIAMPEAMAASLPETDDGGIAATAVERVVRDAGRCAALLVGPGLVNDDHTAALVSGILSGVDEACAAIVLDAAAMMRLRDLRPLLMRRPGRVIVTPHAGEMAGMLGLDRDAIETDPDGTALRTARDFGVVVALKGARTSIAAPDGTLLVGDHGHPGLGTSGSGDTLAGMIVGLLGRGAEPLQAVAWAVYLHGEAGASLARRIGPIGYLAREIPGAVPAVLGALCDDGGA